MEKQITTSRGITVEFVNIAPMLDILQQQNVKRLPKVPTYEIKTATGAVETHEHYQRFVSVKKKDDNGNDTDELILQEETSLTDPDENVERSAREAWAKYLADTEAAQIEYAEKFTKTAMLYGLKFEMPAEDDWAVKQEFVGIEVPTEPLARKWHWIQTELIAGEEEAKLLITGVLAASGTDEEVISAMEDSFRGAVGRTEGDTSQRLGNPAGQAAGQDVVSVQPVRANGHRTQKRHPKPQRVGRNGSQRQKHAHRVSAYCFENARVGILCPAARSRSTCEGTSSQVN